MRAQVRLALALCVLGSFASSCSLLGVSSPVVDRIRRTNTIRIGIAGDHPPLNVRTTSGGIIGLDADLARALALILDVEIELKQMPFKELIDAVRSHEIDAAISGITMTPRRNMDVMFAGPYFVSTKSILGKSETLERVTSIADLETRVETVAVRKRGKRQSLAEFVLEKPKLIWVSSTNEGIDKVRNGEVDAMVVDSPIAGFALRRFPKDDLAMVEVANSESPVGIALSVDDPVFLNIVQNYLANLEEIDILPKLREHWLEGDASWIRHVE